MSTGHGDTISEIVNDESLAGLRRAYHELESFQLTEEHLVTRKRLKDRIAEIQERDFVIEEEATASDDDPL